VSDYQLFSPLSPEEYDALRADITARGILVPIEYDQDGNLLDGHHRAQIAAELGIDFPRLVRNFATEAERRHHVISLNLYRRHLGTAERAGLVAELREAVT
jgi:ParB-like chromosome segregation protein Spo0J